MTQEFLDYADVVTMMLGLELKETRVYPDAKADGREEGRIEEARVLLLKQPKL